MDNSRSHPLIEAKRQELEAARHKVQLLEAELRGMVSFATHISRATLAQPRVDNVMHNSPPKAGGGVHKGRQPGAISTNWRRILAHLAESFAPPGRGFTEVNIINCAKAHGIQSIKPSDARERMAGYMAHGFVKADGLGGYYVTDLAAEKFQFGAIRAEKEPPAPNALEAERSLEKWEQTDAEKSSGKEDQND